MRSRFRWQRLQQPLLMVQCKQHGKLRNIPSVNPPAKQATSFSSTSQLRSDFHTRFPSPHIKIAMATSSNCPANHAPIMRRRLAPAAHTPNPTSASCQTRPKEQPRTCGRRCRDSWAHSRSTRAMASPSRRRVMAVTTALCSTVSPQDLINATTIESQLIKK